MAKQDDHTQASKTAVAYDKHGKPFTLGDILIGKSGIPFKVDGFIEGPAGTETYYDWDVEIAPKGTTVPEHPPARLGSIVWGT